MQHLRQKSANNDSLFDRPRQSRDNVWNGWSFVAGDRARRMLQYSNLMTGGVGLYCDVLVAVGFTCCMC